MSQTPGRKPSPPVPPEIRHLFEPGETKYTASQAERWINLASLVVALGTIGFLLSVVLQS